MGPAAALPPAQLTPAAAPGEANGTGGASNGPHLVYTAPSAVPESSFRFAQHAAVGAATSGSNASSPPVTQQVFPNISMQPSSGPQETVTTRTRASTSYQRPPAAFQVSNSGRSPRPQ